MQLEFSESRDLFDEVIKLNQVMREVADRQLDRQGTSERFRERLAADAEPQVHNFSLASSAMWKLTSAD